MRYSRVLNIVLVLAAVAYGIYQWKETSGAVAATPKAVTHPGDPAPPELKEFMEHAIAVYRAQDFKEIVRLMPPMEVQVLQPRGQELSLDELAKTLRERPAAIASAELNLQELLAVQGKIPELADDGTRAVYRLDQPIQAQVQVVFVKIGDKWYMP